MKKIAPLLLGAVLLLASCGDSQRIGKKVCPTYGFLEDKPKACENVEYRVVTGNIVWSVILGSSIVIPFIILGTDLYEPVPQ